MVRAIWGVVSTMAIAVAVGGAPVSAHGPCHGPRVCAPGGGCGPSGGWNFGASSWNCGTSVGFQNACYAPFTTYSWNTCHRPVGFSSFYCGAPTVNFGWSRYGCYGGGWNSSVIVGSGFCDPYWSGYGPYSYGYVPFGYGASYGYGYGYAPAYGCYPVYPYYGTTVVVRRPWFARRERKPLGLAEVTAAEIDRRVEEDRNRPYGLSDVDRPETAEKYLSMGDESFRAGKYAEALRRYRMAEDASPRTGEVFRRKGHAYVASGQYKLAAIAFKRGFSLDPSVGRNGFTLETLYGDDEATKAAHVDRIAQAALKDLENADLYYVLGISLHYDGQVDRATTFFARAHHKSRGGSPRAIAHLALFAPRMNDGVATLEAAESESDGNLATREAADVSR